MMKEVFDRSSKRRLPFIFLWFFFVSSLCTNAQLILNGDMELGAGGLQVVPTSWEAVNGTPDHCDADPGSCATLTYKLTVPSPQGGKWIRFFHATSNNETFGQPLTAPLVAGQEYTVSFYATHSKLNNIATASACRVIVGFSYGPPSLVGSFHKDTVELTIAENWQFHSYTFIASGNFNYLSFGKLDVDASNACYIDDVKIQGCSASIDLGNDTTVCDGETVILDATTANATYLWQDNSTAPTFTASQPGTYWVEVTTSSCSSRDSILVSSVPEPIINLGLDTTLCEGEVLLLDAQTLNASAYLWQDNTSNSSFVVSQPGLYWVDVTVNNCLGSDSIQVDYVPSPLVNLGLDSLLCDGATLLLEAPVSGASAYLWQDNSTGSSFLVSESGTYWVDVTENNCSSRDSIQVDYIPLPAVNLGPDSILCIGETLELDAQLMGANSYLWQDNSSLSTYSVSQEGLYHVTVNTYCGDISDTVFISYHGPVVVNLGNDTSICFGEELYLNPYNPLVDSYLWNDGSTQEDKTIGSGGTYSVTVYIDGCEGYDQINVQIYPQQILDLGEDIILCEPLDSAILSSTIAGSVFLWSTGSNETTITVSEGEYSLEMLDQNNCVLFDTVSVFLKPPQLNLISDHGLCLGERIVLNAHNPLFTSYLWNTGSNKPKIEVNTEGTYIVAIMDTNGCYAVDSVIVSVDGCNLFVPNAFTPSGDLLNDSFRAKGESIQDFEMNIFNRFGELIFESNDIGTGWDGTYKGKASPMGVYVYKITYINSKTLESSFLTHYFHLIR